MSENQVHIPAGKTSCYAANPTMKFYVKDGNPVKVIVPIVINVADENVDFVDFMSIDPEDKTPKGKPRSDYTIQNLKILGAVDPAADLADALEAGASEVTFRWGERAWVPCEVKHNGTFTNVYYGEGIEVNTNKAKKAASHFRKGGGTSGAPANPFAPVGKPVAPPPPRAPASAPKAQEDVSFP